MEKAWDRPGFPLSLRCTRPPSPARGSAVSWLALRSLGHGRSELLAVRGPRGQGHAEGWPEERSEGPAVTVPEGFAPSHRGREGGGRRALQPKPGERSLEGLWAWARRVPVAEPVLARQGSQ